MTTTPLASAATRPRITAFALASGSFLVGLATIAAAWGSQLIGGLAPCDLCLEQRVAYYVGLPVLAVALLLWKRLSMPLWGLLMLAAIGIFLWSTYMGAFHAGVEWGFWPGPTACTGVGGGLSFDTLAGSIERIVPCDEVQFRFLGISLAGYNALISLGIAAALAAALLLRGRRTG